MVDRAPFWCRMGLHSWLYLGSVSVVQPPLGPFDPRSEEDRVAERDKYVCVKCGEETFREPDYGY